MTPHPATGGRLRPPGPLSEDHDVATFACDNEDLNGWLRRRALAAESRTARTYVVCSENRVVGYYCLAAGAVLRTELPTARSRRNTPLRVPVIVIGRLAVDRRFKGRGVGAGLLRDAILRSIEASRAIGVRAILVHAIDDDAASFYRRYGFRPSPLADRTLVLPIETAVKAL